MVISRRIKSKKISFVKIARLDLNKCERNSYLTPEVLAFIRSNYEYHEAVKTAKDGGSNFVFYSEGGHWNSEVAESFDEFPIRKPDLRTGDVIYLEGDHCNDFNEVVHTLHVNRWRRLIRLIGSSRGMDKIEVFDQLPLAGEIVLPICRLWIAGECPSVDGGGGVFDPVDSIEVDKEEVGVWEEVEVPSEKVEKTKQRKKKLVTCKFRHYYIDDKEFEAVERSKESHARQVAKQETMVLEEKAAYRGGVHVHREGEEEEAEGDHGRNAHKNYRSRKFVDWLVGEFGVDYLSSGSGVLDVAGGKGGVSFELYNRFGVPCTVVDPVVRRTPINKKKRKMLEKSGKDVERGIQFVHEYFNDAFVQDTRYSELFNNSSLVIGMHADEATGWSLFSSPLAHSFIHISFTCHPFSIFLPLYFYQRTNSCPCSQVQKDFRCRSMLCFRCYESPSKATQWERC